MHKIIFFRSVDYFNLNNFVWVSSWPNKSKLLPKRCATATFTISSNLGRLGEYQSFKNDLEEYS